MESARYDISFVFSKNVIVYSTNVVAFDIQTVVVPFKGFLDGLQIDVGVVTCTHITENDCCVCGTAFVNYGQLWMDAISFGGAVGVSFGASYQIAMRPNNIL